jgi:hypothetical protein
MLSINEPVVERFEKNLTLNFPPMPKTYLTKEDLRIFLTEQSAKQF